MSTGTGITAPPSTTHGSNRHPPTPPCLPTSWSSTVTLSVAGDAQVPGPGSRLRLICWSRSTSPSKPPWRRQRLTTGDSWAGRPCSATNISRRASGPRKRRLLGELLVDQGGGPGQDLEPLQRHPLTGQVTDAVGAFIEALQG